MLRIKLVLCFLFAVFCPTNSSPWETQDPAKLLIVAQTLYQTNRFDEALESFEQVISLDPKLMDAHLGKAMILLDKGNYFESIGAIDKAIRIQPSALLYTNKGVALLRTKRFDEALKSHDKAIKMDPNLWVAYWNKAETLYSKGDY